MAWSIVKRTLRYGWKHSATGPVRHSWTTSRLSAGRCAIGDTASESRLRYRRGKLERSTEDLQHPSAPSFLREPVRGKRLELCFAATPLQEKHRAVLVARPGQLGVQFQRRTALLPSSFAANPYVGKEPGKLATGQHLESPMKRRAVNVEQQGKSGPLRKAKPVAKLDPQASLRHRAGVWQARRVLHWYSRLSNDESARQLHGPTAAEKTSTQSALLAYAALHGK